MSTESNFRQSLAGFRWAQGQPEGVPEVSESDTLFGRLTGSVSGYIPVRSNERTNEEEAYITLSRWERFVAFLICTAGAFVCFALAFFIGLPLLAVKPRKFAVSFSLGSILFMAGFSLLQGPVNHAKHIFSAERLPFTLSYFGSLILTLYFAVGRRSYIPSLICAVVQVAALASYLVAYFPGGWQTLSFGSRVALRGASSLLPT